MDGLKQKIKYFEWLLEGVDKKNEDIEKDLKKELGWLRELDERREKEKKGNVEQESKPAEDNKALEITIKGNAKEIAELLLAATRPKEM